MPVREVIEINEELCDGCGDCITACAEGALALVDGKAKLVSDVYCDGLGACIGDCPQGAISIIHREADDFDEVAVERHLTGQRGRSVGPMVANQLPVSGGPAAGSSCPGSRTQAWNPSESRTNGATEVGSQLRQWPIQLHLVPPTAPFFVGSDVLLAADCVAYAVGGFHGRYLDGHGLAIACPKLDSHQEVYLEKLTTMIDEAGIKSLNVMVMEVPCCSGLVQMVREARSRATRDIPIRCTVVGVQGNILAEQSL
jgi:Fe-S-cluster-containing hydrogenase component 2